MSQQSLSDQIEQIKDEHAAKTHTSMVANAERRRHEESIFFLGRIKQNEQISQAITFNLSSQSIRAIEQFAADKRHEAFGYTQIKDFLNESPMSPMTYRQYNDRVALLRGHGDEIYDLLTSVGISVRSQKLLGKGDLAIKGDRLVVGDEEIDVANTGIIKEVLNELFDEKRRLESDLAKERKKVEERDATIDAGVAEYRQLERNLDALQKGDPHDIAVTRCISALVALPELIGQMPDKRKAAAGDSVLPALWTLIRRIRRSYGTAFTFDEHSAETSAEIDNIAAEVFAAGEEDDDV